MLNGGRYCVGSSTWMHRCKINRQVLNEIKERSGKYGMVTMCVGADKEPAGIRSELIKNNQKL